MITYVERYAPEDLRGDRGRVYVFGDNAMREGTGGQAVIRHEPNAYGVVTKFVPGTDDRDYVSDDRFEEYARILFGDLQGLNHLVRHGIGIVFPRDGIGTGLAAMGTRAPRCWRFLVGGLRVIGISNPRGDLVKAGP